LACTTLAFASSLNAARSRNNLAPIPDPTCGNSPHATIAFATSAATAKKYDETPSHYWPEWPSRSHRR
jgi:hypothetical protein